ncbi:MAG TPA: flagellin, partial [Clostridiales bacterium]|nr:flagellin [Clostridiales bacterium]
GLNQASSNAQDGISLIQTAEGALSEVHSILQRMRELGVQASNETYNSDDIEAIQHEVDALLTEIDNIADNTKFNGTTLLDGQGAMATGGITLAIGANTENLVIEISDMNIAVLGDATNKLSSFKADQANDIKASGTGKTTRGNAQLFIASLDEAIKSVSDERAKPGANQNRLEHTIKNLDNTSENLQAAESRIRDVDMAKEMMEFTKNSILQQAAQSMLAQANQAPQGVLQLLR